MPTEEDDTCWQKGQKVISLLEYDIENMAEDPVGRLNNALWNLQQLMTTCGQFGPKLPTTIHAFREEFLAEAKKQGYPPKYPLYPTPL